MRLLERRRLVLASALLLGGAGVAAWQTMPREEDPQLPRRHALVTVVFPGADAATVERLVVEPVEDHLAEVEEVVHTEATARQEAAVISVEIDQSIYDTDRAWDEVDRALLRAAREFPEGVRSPELDRDIFDQESVVLAVTGSPDLLELAEAAEAVRDELLGSPLVARVRWIADPGEQITIALDDAEARRLGIDYGSLAIDLAARNRTSPAGSVRVGERSASVRPSTEFRSLEEIANTPIVLASGAAVPLGAVADVARTPAEPATSRLRLDGQPAVGLGVVARRNIDVLSFGREVREVLDRMRSELGTLRIQEVTYQPARVARRLDSLAASLGAGVLIVAGVVCTFMGMRLGLVVASVVPMVTLASLAVFAMGGGILHQMSIAALVVALGLLVDNAIVVAEAVQQRIDEGLDPADAARQSVRSLALPLGTATGTTLAAFVPMLLAGGTSGDFTRALPVVVMLTLAASYVFAIAVTPVLCSMFLRRREGAHEDAFRRLGRAAAALARQRPGLVLGAVAVLVTGSVLGAGLLDRSFFPPTDRNEMVVDVELPEGSHLAATDEVARKLEAALAGRADVESVFVTVGRGLPRFYYNIISRPFSPHLAQLLVVAESVEAVAPLRAWVRDWAAAAIPEAQITARKLEQGPPRDAPIEVRLRGTSLEDLGTAADQVVAMLRDIPGTIDVRHDLGTGVPSLRFAIDDARAGRSRLTRADVAAALLGRTRGLAVGSYRADDDPVPIVVRSAEGEDYPATALETIDVWKRGTDPVPLGQLADARVEWQPGSIKRRDRLRVVAATAQLQEGYNFGRVLDEFEMRFAALALPAGIRLERGGDADEASEANGALLGTLPLGILLLLFFLLVEFDFLRRVGIVLVTVPLAATGVVPGLLVAGEPFGFMSLLGVIALVGIVVNNAIVLLDVIECRREAGDDLDDAIEAALATRTRPILLTTLTTVAGLLPLVLSDATMWPPMAWAMISGLLASTALTLLVVPALYRLLLIDRPKRRRWATLLEPLRRRSVHADPAVAEPR